MRSFILPILVAACVETPEGASEAAATEATAQQTVSSEPLATPTALPEYRVLDAVNQLNGVRYGDIMVATMSRDTPVNRLMDVATAIAQREGFGEISLYCSEAAMRAAFSASYAAANPKAVKCYLGRLKGRQFTASR